jgi:hypothetical protein
MIINDKIKKEDLESPFTKAVADIKKKTLSLGCELHSDCADELIRNDSKGSDLWGFNIYPDGHLDFVSLINIRPAVGNRSMEIKDKEICQKIEEIVRKFLSPA